MCMTGTLHCLFINAPFLLPWLQMQSTLIKSKGGLNRVPFLLKNASSVICEILKSNIRKKSFCPNVLARIYKQKLVIVNVYVHVSWMTNEWDSLTLGLYIFSHFNHSQTIYMYQKETFHLSMFHELNKPLQSQVLHVNSS